MTKVFISHSAAESDLASEIRKALDDVEIVGFFDQSSIEPGDSITAKVMKSLKQSGTLIVLVTPRSLESKWVQFEVGAAFAMEKQIIPVVVGTSETQTSLPDWLTGYLYIDARDRPMNEIAIEIRKAIGDERPD